MYTVHIISHTHWDREWYVPFQFTREWLPHLFDSLFVLLKQEAHYKFVLNGSTEVLEDYLQQLPSQEWEKKRAMIRYYVRNAQLFIGPYYVQVDWNLLSGSSLVRNLLYGQKDGMSYGAVQRVAWLVDNFGQTSQTPQIHQQFSCKGMFLWRGLNPEKAKIKTEYTWVAPDGSSLPAVYLIDSYRNGMQLARTDFLSRIKEAVSRIAPFAATAHLLMMNGYDQEFVPDNVADLIRKYSTQSDVQLRQSSPEEYIHATFPHDAMQQIQGEQLNGAHVAVFPGVWTNRPYLKSESARIARMCAQYLDPLSVLLHLHGYDDKAAEREDLWRSFLKMQAHDNICGVSVDDIHVDMEDCFATLLKKGHSMLSSSMCAMFMPGDELRYLVFNPLPEPQSAVVEIPEEVSAAQPVSKNTQPMRQQKGMFRLFSEVPPLGISTYSLTSPTERLPPALYFSEEKLTIRNAWLALNIHENGTFSLCDVQNDHIYGPLHIFEDGADAGDTYNYSPCQYDQCIRELGKVRISFSEKGSLLVRVKIESELSLPVSLSASRKEREQKYVRLPILTELTITSVDPFVSIRSEILNTACDHRLRLCFPTGLSSAQAYYHVPFDVVCPRNAKFSEAPIPPQLERLRIGAREHDASAPHPFQHFAALALKDRGLALFSKSFSSCEHKDDALILSLYRSVGWLARDDLLSRVGDAGPCIPTPDAQLLRPLIFEYGLAPFHKGLPELISRGDKFLSPPYCVAAKIDPVFRDAVHSNMMLHTQKGKVCYDEWKRAEDGKGSIFRYYNPLGIPAHVEMQFPDAWTVSQSRLDESKVKDTQERSHVLAPHRVETLRIEYVRAQRSAHEVPKPKVCSKMFVSLNGPWHYHCMGLKALLEEEIERLSSLEKEVSFLKKQCETTPDNLMLQRRYSTRWRHALEAQLSCALLRHRLKGEGRVYTESTVEEIRSIAWQLNNARIEKRCIDFLVAHAASS